MKTVLQIAGLAAILFLLSASPVGHRMGASVRPEMARVVQAVNSRFPGLVVVETIWETRAPAPAARFRRSELPATLPGKCQRVTSEGC